jgi:uncharacterized protein YdaU (DUF1376 family)
MHYFQFNIGDYKSHTNHLDLLEDLAYRRLLDLYYLHERPLNSGITAVARQIGMRDHETQVKTILEEFFCLTEDGWVNSRADREIQHYHGKIEQASRAGKASAERRSNARSTDVQPTNNQEPITNKHKTIKERATNVACPPDVNEQVWQDWLQLRKLKKASVTETVVKGARSEAAKLGWELEKFLVEWCTRGSQGLKAEWVTEKQIQNGLTKTGQRNATVLQGLTRGLLGGQSNVQLLK